MVDKVHLCLCEEAQLLGSTIVGGNYPLLFTVPHLCRSILLVTFLG